MLQLKIEKREGGKGLDAMRKEGSIPAVYYGKSTDSTPITIDAKEFGKVWSKAGETTLVELVGSDGVVPVMIYKTDEDPVSGSFRHVDFYTIEKGQRIEVDVPLEFVGVSPAVKDLGGILVKVVHEFRIEAEPKDMPQHLTVDISSLVDFESQIHAKDIALPPGVVLLIDGEDVVAAVAQAKEEVEEVSTEIDMSKIEVEKKGKKEVESEGEAGDGAEKKE